MTQASSQSAESPKPGVEPASAKASPAAKRRVRNMLLEPAFQLKYTSMVIVVTLVVGSVLGFFVYRNSKAQTQQFAAAQLGNPEADLEAVQNIQQMAEEQDQKVLISVVTGVLALVIIVALTGVVITHRVVGPAYRIRMLMREVADGNWRPAGKLRKNDELQNLFAAFSDMLDTLRSEQAAEIEELESAIGVLSKSGVTETQLEALKKLQAKMSSKLT